VIAIPVSPSTPARVHRNEKVNETAGSTLAELSTHGRPVDVEVEHVVLGRGLDREFSQQTGSGLSRPSSGSTDTPDPVVSPNPMPAAIVLLGKAPAVSATRMKLPGLKLFHWLPLVSGLAVGVDDGPKSIK
jgi:hypothetical protein